MLPIPFAALPRDCPGNRSENRQCAQCKKTQPLLRKSVHKGAVKQENIGQFRPHSPRRRVGRPGRRHPACGQLPCARTNTAELGAAPLSGQMCRQGRERGGRHLRSGVPSDDANAAARRCHCMAMLSPGRPSAWPVPQKAAFRCAEGSGNARCTAKRQGGFLDTMAQTFQAGYLLEQSKKHLHAAQPKGRLCHAWRREARKRLCQKNGSKRCMKEGAGKNSRTAKPKDLRKLL